MTWPMRVWLFVTMVNGPLAAVLAWDEFGARVSRAAAMRRLKKGGCGRREHPASRSTCGMPIAARIDIFEGYEYRFHQWVCDQHARDAERRGSGRRFRVEWLQAQT